MILFTADIHIKLGQKNVPKDWAKNRYRMFFEQVKSLEKMCNMHIVGGDVFDRIPTMEELELYFEFIRAVSIPTVIYPGNHEMTTKYQSFFSQLKQVTRDINPLVQVVDISYVDTDMGFSILPYTELHKKNSIEAFDTSMPLFTHVRGAIPPHVKPEVDLDRFEDFPVVFTGDLHSHSNCQRNLVYPGSPMTTSFHRNRVETGYILINPQDWSWIWEPFDLPQLIRKTVSSTEEMVPTDFDHTIYEIEGDIQELSNVNNNNDLLDKKVVKRANEASLILEKDMSIEEELHEYLRYVLEINEQKIPDILGVFSDYASKITVE